MTAITEANNWKPANGEDNSGFSFQAAVMSVEPEPAAVPIVPDLEPTESAEIQELRSEAREWQSQFHILRARIEARGFDVRYDDNGNPAVFDR